VTIDDFMRKTRDADVEAGTRILIFNPDAGQWMPVTGFTIEPKSKTMRLYADKD
jgi:hypothetical protein